MNHIRHLTCTLFLLGVSPSVSAAGRVMEPKDIPTIKAAQDAQISPDGRLVAFVVSEVDAKENAYQTEIWLADVRTGESRTLTQAKKSSDAPSFSPDGSSLAFLSDRDGNRKISTGSTNTSSELRVRSKEECPGS